MTAATEVDLEAWMQGEVEVPCTLAIQGKQCGCPARWVGYARCDTCGGGADQRFICDECYSWLSAGGFPHGGPRDCWTSVTVTWIERIKR